GPSFEKIEQLKAAHMPPSIYNIYKKPLLLHQGHMQWLYDHEGRRKIVSALQQQVSTLWHTTNIYRHPKIYEYVEQLVAKFPGDLKIYEYVEQLVAKFPGDLKQQVSTLWHTTNIYRHPKIYEYVEQLVAKFPSDLKANDLAVLLAKAYTGNNDIISLQSSYHGCSSALMGLTATQLFYQTHIEDHGVAAEILCPKSQERVPVQGVAFPPTNTSSNLMIVAALFAESIQGAGGVTQFPKGYIKKAQALIKKNGGLLIADEVQTGFGRTGDNFWGFESHGVIPDIVTMAKGIGNGFPLAAVVTTKEIAATHKVSYFNTFGGNALAATAGKAVLDIIEEDKLQQNSKEVGSYFIKQLLQLQKIHPIVGDVRGQGLMLGAELVVPHTKEALPGEKVADIIEALKDIGVLVARGGRWNNVLRIKPPMCITKDDVDFTFISIVTKCEPTKEPLVEYGKTSDFEGYQITLDNTILFPAGGGQPHDVGFLNETEVVQVLRKGDEAVHFTKEPLQVGATIVQRIDWDRRFDHMQQHSAILEQEHSLKTTSWWLGADECHVELDSVKVPEEALRAAEESELQVVKLLGTEPGKKGKTLLKFLVGNRVTKTFQVMLDREKAMTALLVITELLKGKGAFKNGRFQGKAADLGGINKCKKLIEEYFNKS
ncbi:Alanine-glyoxylate aminotransferase, partial [Operophtera brumata]